jgi:hypothetical protein
MLSLEISKSLGPKEGDDRDTHRRPDQSPTSSSAGVVADQPAIALRETVHACKRLECFNRLTYYKERWLVEFFVAGYRRNWLASVFAFAIMTAR